MTPYEELDAIYATLPTINCQKKCGFTNCGPLQASKLEVERITEKTGLVKITDRATWQDPGFFQFRHLPYYLEKADFYRTMEFFEPDQGTMNCQFLMPVIGTCRVYNLRPLICRVWGLVNHPAMRCRFGCEPDRWVTNAEAKKLFYQVAAIQERMKE